MSRWPCMFHWPTLLFCLIATASQSRGGEVSAARPAGAEAVRAADEALSINVAGSFRVFTNVESLPAFPAELATDGRPETSWRTGSNQAYLQLLAEKPVAIERIVLHFPAAATPDDSGLVPAAGQVLARRGGEWESVFEFTANQTPRVEHSFNPPLITDALRYIRQPAKFGQSHPVYVWGMAEMEVYSREPLGPRPAPRNLAPQARVETSHKRYKGGQVECVNDNDPSTIWLAGPYAQLFLRFAQPVEIQTVRLDFGSTAARATAYLLQLRQNGRWVDYFRIHQNDEARRQHRLPPETWATGVRWIPLTTAQASDTRLAEIEVLGYGEARPGSAEPEEWAKVVAARRTTRRPAFGIYAVDHWRNFFPAVAGDGVEYYSLWRELEPREGEFDWSGIDEVLSECGRHGQKVVLKVMASDACPEWIYSRGVPKVLNAGDPEDWRQRYDPPVYWDPAYLRELERMIRAVAERYDGNESLDSVILTLAGTGEMGRFLELKHADWERAGYTDQVFSAAMNRIVDFYADAFRLTPLICQISYIASSGSATPAWLVAEHAAGRGVMVEQATLDDLLGASLHPHPSVIGPVTFVDIYRRLQGKTGLSGEMNVGFVYNQSQPYPSRFPEVLWQAYLNGLALGLTHFSVYAADLFHPATQELTAFARRRLGKSAADAPSVWLNPRGQPLENAAVGLQLVESEGARTIACPGWITKQFCRRTDLAAGQSRMSFKIAPEFVASHPGDLQLRIVFWDHGLDNLGVGYHSLTGNEAQAERLDRYGNRLALAPLVAKQGTELWREARFLLPAQRATGEWDFWLEAGAAGDEYVHFVEVAEVQTRLEEIWPE